MNITIGNRKKISPCVWSEVCSSGSKLLSKPIKHFVLFISQDYSHVLLHLFFFIFRLTELAANIETSIANSSFMALRNEKQALHEASDAMFLVLVSCVPGVHNLDPNFWYEILVGALNLQGIEFTRKGGGNCKERNIQGKAPQFASV